MKTALIETTGWIGDILFSLSLADKLKKEQDIGRLDYLIDKPQPYILVKNNKYIDNVYLNSIENKINYDVIYKLPVIESKEELPTIQYQKYCNIKNLDSAFYVDVPEDFNIKAKELLSSYKKVITVQGDWGYRFWDITNQESINKKFDQTGVFSYYKTLRPGNIVEVIKKIESRLNNQYQIFIINPWSGDPKYNLDPRGYSNDSEHYTTCAAIIKNSCAFLGAEGGLTNLSAALGVKTIYTTCHMHRMFGSNGVMSQSNDIQLGPQKLFPNRGHVAISPYATLDEVVETIVGNIQ